MAVVDYFIVQQGDLPHVLSMEVISCGDLIDQQGWVQLISDTCRPLDHNLLRISVELSCIVCEGLHDRNLGSKNFSCENRQKVRRKVGWEYMKSDTAKKLLPFMLEEFEGKSDVENKQLEVNALCSDLSSLILSEANRSVKSLGKNALVHPLRNTGTQSCRCGGN